MIISEVRPRWNNPTEINEHGVAKATFRLEERKFAQGIHFGIYKKYPLTLSRKHHPGAYHTR